MDIAVVYHWWSDKDIEKTFRCPILCSIATFRAHNPKIPVYVLDVTENSTHEWEKWEDKLNFKAIKYIPYLRKLNIKSDFYSLTEPSRHIDVYNFGKSIKENILFYSDSDVFYVKSILPLSQEPKKIISPVFTAYFYFDKNLTKTKEFIEYYRKLCIKCLKSEEFAKKLYNYCPYNIKGRRLWSEVITYYLEKTGKEGKFIEKMNTNEFANIDKAYQRKKIKQAKSLHLFYNGQSLYDEMDYVTLFKEFKNPVDYYLGKDFIQTLKPKVNRTISLYDKRYCLYMYNLTKDLGNKPYREFIEKTFEWVNGEAKL